MRIAKRAQETAESTQSRFDAADSDESKAAIYETLLSDQVELRSAKRDVARFNELLSWIKGQFPLIVSEGSVSSQGTGGEDHRSKTESRRDSSPLTPKHLQRQTKRRSIQSQFRKYLVRCTPRRSRKWSAKGHIEFCSSSTCRSVLYHCLKIIQTKAFLMGQLNHLPQRHAGANGSLNGRVSRRLVVSLLLQYNFLRLREERHIDAQMSTAQRQRQRQHSNNPIR